MKFPATLMCVSLAEWLGWVHQHDIVVSLGRLRTVTDERDQGSFWKLLVAAHDAGAGDDQSYIVAELTANAVHSPKWVGTAPFEFVSIPMSAVASFRVASARGSVLLKAESERLGINLGPPVFDPLWECWRSEREAARELAKGARLVEALGLPSVAAAPLWLARLKDPDLVPANLRDAVQKCERKPAWGFCVALIAYGVRSVEATRGTTHVTDMAAKLLEVLKQHGPIELFDLPQSGLYEMALEVDLLTQPVRAAYLPDFLVFSIAAHFRHAFSESNLDPDQLWSSFGVALSFLASNSGVEKAAECAFAVGCAMPDSMVSQVLYAASPERYPSVIAGGLSFSPRELVKIADPPASEPSPPVTTVIEAPSSEPSAGADPAAGTSPGEPLPAETAVTGTEPDSVQAQDGQATGSSQVEPLPPENAADGTLSTEPQHAGPVVIETTASAALHGDSLSDGWSPSEQHVGERQPTSAGAVPTAVCAASEGGEGPSVRREEVGNLESRAEVTGAQPVGPVVLGAVGEGVFGPAVGDPQHAPQTTASNSSGSKKRLGKKGSQRIEPVKPVLQGGDMFESSGDQVQRGIVVEASHGSQADSLVDVKTVEGQS